MALRTFNLHFLKAASWNTDLLAASRTAVNMIILTLAHHALLFLKPGSILGGNRKIFLILCIALGNILGKNPVIRIDKSCHSQNVQEPVPLP